MGYYPVSLDVRGRRCVVVGGDALAEEKARGLAAAEARVVVIAVNPTPGLDELAQSGAVQLLRRPYRHGDLSGVFLVIVAQGEARERQAIWLEALQNQALMNSVDDLPRCSFIAPAVIRRGDLT
ncbi:MAG TPA: NAD(P)-dependent oxidoreductase, partial [Thermoanaerobaculia bacterium]